MSNQSAASRNRHPKGVATGGQFAAESKPEAGSSLVLTAAGPVAGTSDEAYDDFIADEAVRLVKDPEYLAAQKALSEARQQKGVAESAEKAALNDVYLETCSAAQTVKNRLKQERVIGSKYDEQAFDTETSQLANQLAFGTRFTDIPTVLPAEDAAKNLLLGAGRALVKSTFKELIHREVLQHPEPFTAAVSAARAREAAQDAFNAAGGAAAQPMARLNAARAQRDLPVEQRRDVADLHEIEPGTNVIGLMMAGFTPAN
ncbi:hypothetical protein LG293_17550 (plasmid) [Citricoccus nitrophenolicus]